MTTRWGRARRHPRRRPLAVQRRGLLPTARSGACPQSPAQVALSEQLAAARELLHNPPELAVSPDVMRQWCDDIDRLIILA